MAKPTSGKRLGGEGGAALRLNTSSELGDQLRALQAVVPGVTMTQLALAAMAAGLPVIRRSIVDGVKAIDADD